MRTLRVINKGKQTRYRLGIGFEPNEPIEIKVSNREFLTVSAVKDFEVEYVTEETKEQNEQLEGTEGNEDNTENHTEDEFSFEDLNIEESLKAVEEGKISVDEAIALETANKNRSTLLEKLEEMNEEQGE